MGTHAALFITGTDTDVGKTTFAAALCYAIAKAGYQPGYYKPVLSGATVQNGQLVGGDLSFVQATAQMSEAQLHCTYLFEPPVSPHLAAQLASLKIEPQRIQADFNAHSKVYSHLIVEGAGGAACPISSELPIYTLSHLMVELQTPVAIVCRASLGTLHHTAATLAYLKQFNIPIAGLLISSFEETPVCQNNLSMLTKMTGLPILAILPKLNNCDPESLRQAVDTHWDCQELVRRLFP